MDQLQLPAFLRPKVRLFLSADIVGSTGFKQERIAFSPLFSSLDIDTSKESQPWPSFFIEFFSILTRAFKEKIFEHESKVGLQDSMAPRLWKSLGDEIIATKIIETTDEAAVSVACWISAAMEARAFIRKYSDSLDVKLSAWTAEFPVSNSEVAYFHEMMVRGQVASEFRQYLYDFEREHINKNENKLKLPREQGILNSSILEIYYRRKEKGVIRDFIGPSIDNGFRVSALSSPVWMPISIELAYFIARSHEYQIGAHFNIARMQRQRLKGVMGGRPYPVFFIDLAGNTNDKFKVERAYREMVNADDQRLDAEKISEYCKKFFKDNRNYFYRPFIPKYSDVYIEEDMKVSDELATLFSDQIEGLAVKFLGQIQMFRDWLDENRPEPEVYIDILNDLESIVPPDLSKMYESRVEDWLVKTEENSR